LNKEDAADDEGDAIVGNESSILMQEYVQQ
jgi:hypothetical protein